MASNTGETHLPTSEAFLIPERTSAWAWFAIARRELWRFLPAWMYLIYACLLLNTELTNFSPPRPDLATTIVFPLAVFVVFYAVRALKAPDVQQRLGMLAIIVTLAFGLPMLNLSFHRPSPLALDTLLRFYEYSNFLWAGVLIAHAWKHRRSHVALFFGVGLVYGAVLENGGIVLGFFHEMNLGSTMVKPMVAPIATMIGWCVVLYMATWVVWRLRDWLPWLRRSTMLSALAVGGFATMLDLQIDPIATAAGCWVWHQSLPGFFHGVPLVNFVAWMCALTPFAYVMFRLQDRFALRDNAHWTRRQLLIGLAAAPATLTLAALAFMVCTVVIEGARGPSWTILNEFTVRALSLVGS